MKEEKEESTDPRYRIKKFIDENGLEKTQLKYNEVKCGDLVYHISLFKNGEYKPHLVEHEVTMIFWNKGVTDYTDYFRIV